MNNAIKAGGVVLIAFVVIAASRLAGAESSLDNGDSPGARAGAAAQAFSGELRTTLMTAMREGGPSAAVRVCHDDAPRIAARIEREHGVRLGRVGVRSRQAANRLTGWQKDVLDRWQASSPPGAPGSWSPSITHDAGTVRWAKAIETEGPCLACHGTAISPELKNTLQELYPDDQATGFTPGSLRGLIWVEVPSVSNTTAPAAPAGGAKTEPDARQPIRMTAIQATALRGQMRNHLEHLEGVLLALSQNDAVAAAELLDSLTAPQPRLHEGDFRQALPSNWQRFSAPMHRSLRDASGHAAKGDTAAALGELGAATAQCNACHVTYRIEVGT